MQVSPINNYNFRGNIKQSKTNNKSSNKVALGALTYATIFALFPHNYEKLVNNIDINFKNLPIKDKAKNVGKFALPFLGYPAMVMGGLFCVTKLIQKHEQNNPDKENKWGNFIEKNKEKIKKIGNIFYTGLMASSLLYVVSKTIKTASKDISKKKEIVENIKEVSAAAVFLGASSTFIPKFNDYIDKKLFSKNIEKNT